jgi:hypothetical protein
MTTLTKTQQRLIDRARSHGGAAAVEAGSGRGALGGRMSFGSRERTALHQLVEMGLVKIIHQDSDHFYNNGYCLQTASYLYKLTKATGATP